MFSRLSSLFGDDSPKTDIRRSSSTPMPPAESGPLENITALRRGSTDTQMRVMNGPPSSKSSTSRPQHHRSPSSPLLKNVRIPSSPALNPRSPMLSSSTSSLSQSGTPKMSALSLSGGSASFAVLSQAYSLMSHLLLALQTGSESEQIDAFVAFTSALETDVMTSTQLNFPNAEAIILIIAEVKPTTASEDKCALAVATLLILSRNPTNKTEIAVAGGLAWVCSVMRHYPISARVQEWCCRLIGSMAMTKANLERIMVEGGVGLVVEAMLRHRDVISVNVEAWFALGNMALAEGEERTVHARIISEGGMGVLRSSLASHAGWGDGGLGSKKVEDDQNNLCQTGAVHVVEMLLRACPTCGGEGCSCPPIKGMSRRGSSASRRGSQQQERRGSVLDIPYAERLEGQTSPPMYPTQRVLDRRTSRCEDPSMPPRISESSGFTHDMRSLSSPMLASQAF